IVFLLWPGADGPAMTGKYRLPTGEVFRYHLTKLWEKDVDELFNSIATVAFAPLARFAPERLPEVVRRLEEGIATTAKNDDEKTNVWFLAYSSMGLRYPAAQVNDLLAHKLPFLLQTPQCRRLLSDGYYAGHSRGEEEGQFQATRRWVLRLGSQRLG